MASIGEKIMAKNRTKELEEMAIIYENGGGFGDLIGVVNLE